MDYKGNLTKDLTQAMYKLHQTETPSLTKDSILHAIMLQEFLDWTNRQWNVNAWWRGVSYNKSVGGVNTSNHLRGVATDVSFKGKTKMDYVGKLDKYAKKWFEICDKYEVYGEFGLYPDFYHIGSHITYQKKHCKFDRRSGKTVYL